MGHELEDFFLYYLTNHLTDDFIKKNRKNMIDELTKSFPNITKIKENIIKKCFEILDVRMFGSTIGERVKRDKFNLSFKTSGRYKNVAGTFGHLNKDLTFTFSKKILDNLFDENTNTVEINGIQCKSLTETIVILMEHELTHMILFLMKDHKDNIGTEKSGHTVTFKKFVRNAFNHVKITHSLNLGDIDKHNEENETNKKILGVGDTVSFKNEQGILVGIKGVRGIISMNQEKYITSYLKDITLIKKSSVDVERELLLRLKNKKSEMFDLNVGSKNLKVQIVDFNNKTIKFLTSENKMLKVYIWYLIGKF